MGSSHLLNKGLPLGNAHATLKLISLFIFLLLVDTLLLCELLSHPPPPSPSLSPWLHSSLAFVCVSQWESECISPLCRIKGLFISRLCWWSVMRCSNRSTAAGPILSCCIASNFYLIFFPQFFFMWKFDFDFIFLCFLRWIRLWPHEYQALKLVSGHSVDCR